MESIMLGDFMDYIHGKIDFKNKLWLGDIGQWHSTFLTLGII